MIPQKTINLSPDQERAYLRLSKLFYFTAANLERDEQILKGLVTLGLAKMTRENGKLSFIRCPTKALVGKVKLYENEPKPKPKKETAAEKVNRILGESYMQLAALKRAKRRTL